MVFGLGKKTTFIEIAGETTPYRRAMRDVERINKKTTQAVRSSWLQIAGATYGAIKAWDLAKLGVRAQQEANAFRNMAASYGMSADDIISDLKKVSANTIDTATLIQKAGTAMMMGISPDKLSKLMAIARATSKMTGQTVTKSFEDISLAVGRQSRMILDNLGIIVKAGEANEMYAEQLGKTSSELSEAEKKMAFLNATIVAGEDLMKRLGKQTKTTAEMFQSFEALVGNLKIGIGQGLVTAARWIVIGFTQAGNTINMFFEQFVIGARQLAQWLGKKIPGMDFFEKLSLGAAGMVEHLRLARLEANKFTDELLKMGKATPVTARPMPALGGGGEAAEAGPDIDKITGKYAERLAREYMAEVEQIAQLRIRAEEQHRQEVTNIAQEWMASDLAMAQGHANALVMIEKERIDQEIQLNEYMKNAKQQIALNGLTMMMNVGKAVEGFTGRHSKTLFAMMKGVEVAKATISAFSAANQALATPPGPPYTIPLSVGVLAMGLANAAAIAGTAIGTLRSGGAAATPGGGAVIAAPVPVASPDITQVRGAGGRPSLSIHIEGDFIGDESYIDNLVEKISGAVEDRDVRLVATGTRFENEAFA
jgi:hypothetical protein